MELVLEENKKKECRLWINYDIFSNSYINHQDETYDDGYLLYSLEEKMTKDLKKNVELTNLRVFIK